MWDRMRRETDRSSDADRNGIRQHHLLLLGLTIVVALSLIYLWQSWRWTSAYNELQDAHAQLETLEAERQRVRFQVERAFSLERIERISTDQLDMSRPEPRYLDLSNPDDDQP